MIVLEKHCERCTKIFVKPFNCSLKNWANRRFCSWECNRNPVRICLICNKEFRARGKRRSKIAKYCSFSCYNIGKKGIIPSNLNEAQKNSPIKFGKDNINWKGGSIEYNGWYPGQKKRILIRDNYKCQDCFTKQNLIIHHILFEHIRTEDSNLITLCRSCHMKRHSLQRQLVRNKIVRVTFS